MCLDDKLSWEGQCAHVYQKAAAGTFMLAQLKRTVPCRIRLMIYNSLVRPYFEYCIEVWGCSKASNLKVFLQLQKICVRHILGAGYRASAPSVLCLPPTSVFQNLPIEIYFLSSHSTALSMELTTHQLGYPSFGVWKTWN